MGVDYQANIKKTLTSAIFRQLMRISAHSRHGGTFLLRFYKSSLFCVRISPAGFYPLIK